MTLNDAISGVPGGFIHSGHMQPELTYSSSPVMV